MVAFNKKKLKRNREKKEFRLPSKEWKRVKEKKERKREKLAAFEVPNNKKTVRLSTSSSHLMKLNTCFSSASATYICYLLLSLRSIPSLPFKNKIANLPCQVHLTTNLKNWYFFHCGGNPVPISFNISTAEAYTSSSFLPLAFIFNANLKIACYTLHTVKWDNKGTRLKANITNDHTSSYQTPRFTSFQCKV